MCVENDDDLVARHVVMSVRTRALVGSERRGSSRISTGGRARSPGEATPAKALGERLDGLVEYAAELQALDDVREACSRRAPLSARRSATNARMWRTVISP